MEIPLLTYFCAAHVFEFHYAFAIYMMKDLASEEL